MDLFDVEDQRILQLPEESRWNIYKNPTPYQVKLNEQYYQCHKTLWLIDWYEKKGAK